MSAVSTVINVNPDSCPATTGNYAVVVHFVTTASDPGSAFGTFHTREGAERGLLIALARTDVKRAEITIVGA